MQHKSFGIIRAELARLQARFKFLQPRFSSYGAQYSPKPLNLKAESYSLSKSNFFPVISIVIPSYNQGKFLERTIKSLLDQKYPNLELIVVDGGSTDNSISILDKYKGHINWWCSEPDGGQVYALNKGFAKTTGEILGWLNSDDCSTSYTFAVVANYFRSNPKAEAVYGHRILINENDEDIGRWVLPPHEDWVLDWADYVPQETLFWRRSLWERVGGQLNEKFSFAMDWELLIKFKQAGAKIVRLPTFLGMFRIHENQKTNAEMKDVGQTEIKIIRKHNIGYDPSGLEVHKTIVFYLAKARLFELLWQIKNRQFESGNCAENE